MVTVIGRGREARLRYLLQSIQLHRIIRIFTKFVRTLQVKIEDYGKEELSRRRGKYYNKRGASVQYGKVTQITEIIRTAYDLHKSLVGGTAPVYEDIPLEKTPAIELKTNNIMLMVPAKNNNSTSRYVCFISTPDSFITIVSHINIYILNFLQNIPNTTLVHA